MSGRVDRPDLDRTVADVHERVRILEAGLGGGGIPGTCCGGVPPLGGFGDCAGEIVLAGFCKDDWTAHSGGPSWIAQACPDLIPGPPGTELWVHGLVYDCAPTLTAGCAVSMGATSAAGLDQSPTFPIYPTAVPDNGVVPWTQIGLLSEAAGSAIDGFMQIDAFGTFSPYTQSGKATSQFAWVPVGCSYDQALADSIVNEGTAYGDMLVWNGAWWFALPAGSAGEVLTMGASGLPEWA